MFNTCLKYVYDSKADVHCCVHDVLNDKNDILVIIDYFKSYVHDVFGEAHNVHVDDSADVHIIHQ